ncbi:NADH-quinone oxidoreductase subunit E [Pseudorhodobacter sp. E13]|uniref:NADH-quinone oxidoreductase subunit E n=1 Tax=Pseudorhodobacter sp. E13 TaxID=2487931 RepID=UPI000F8EDF2E|nr:NADH-quinone oxidoreductase subunit E [Pseudorhodobacter sp. E13]RUS59220.1 NADH-quinone oxidoreductase subunit E [Pseudorhodobacter sp. E13]
MLRRLHKEQPSHFAFTPANLEWAQGQITKYPEGRQASAIIPLLWRAQEQEGWLSRPAIEYVADMLGMAYIRALEVATFYFMFQLQPVGSIANIQICGTTSCMICGAEDLVAVCKELINEKPHALSADGKFSWEEVECLGACTNAPMAQIGKDYYEDLTPEKLRDLIARFSKGEVPVPGPQNGRYASEPLGGLTSLKDFESGRKQYNASVQAAVDIGETVKRIDGTEVPILTPWLGKSGAKPAKPGASAKTAAKAVEQAEDKAPATPKAATKAQEKPVVTSKEMAEKSVGKPAAKAPAKAAEAAKTAETGKAAVKAAETASAGEGSKPKGIKAARKGVADDLKKIEGIGPALEKLCHSLGVFHYDQIAAWGPAEIAWMDSNLKGFKGRVTRDKWVAQAKLIGEVGMEEFLIRAKTNDY